MLLLLATKTFGVGHVVCEKIEYLMTKLLTLSFSGEWDSTRLPSEVFSLNPCPSAPPNPGCSILLDTAISIVASVNEFLSPFTNLDTAAWILREGGNGRSVSRLMFGSISL